MMYIIQPPPMGMKLPIELQTLEVSMGAYNFTSTSQMPTGWQAHQGELLNVMHSDKS
jgi:hypothetical protein